MSYDIENQSIKIEVRLLAVQYPIVCVMAAWRQVNVSFLNLISECFAVIQSVVQMLLIARLVSDCRVIFTNRCAVSFVLSTRGMQTNATAETLIIRFASSVLHTSLHCHCLYLLKPCMSCNESLESSSVYELQIQFKSKLQQTNYVKKSNRQTSLIRNTPNTQIMSCQRNNKNVCDLLQIRAKSVF